MILSDYLIKDEFNKIGVVITQEPQFKQAKIQVASCKLFVSFNILNANIDVKA